MSIIRHRHINRTTKSKIIKKKNKSVSLNKKNKLGNKDLSLLITKRYHFLIVLIIILFLIISIRLFKLQIIDYEDYQSKLTIATEKTVEGTSAPRGRYMTETITY